MTMPSFARRAIALPIAVLVVLPLATCSSGSSAPARAGAAADPVVIGPDDVVTPRAGRDYRVITTLRGSDARQATTVTDDGRVLLKRYDADDQTHFTLLDPRTGRRTKIPSPYHGTEVLEADADEVWYDAGRPLERPHVYHYDRRSEKVRGFVLPDAPGVSTEHGYYRVLGLVEHRVWFSTGRYRADARDIWSVRFGQARTLREEVRNKRRPVLGDGVLAWVTYPGGDYADSAVQTLDVGTGTTATAEMPTGCSIGDEEYPRVNGDQVAVDVSCGADGDDHSTVVADTSSGEIEALLHLGGEDGNLSISDRALFFFWTLYDIESRQAFRIWKLGRVGDANTPPAAGPGAHPVMIWPRGKIDHEEYTRILVLRWK
ncbi:MULTISPECIES: hypothetical protein [unclassified Nocardioides]|uniref:hypothetical protein n=1 Tax=unclassified Nocardioides TaxID=2615069 RepID=UPI0009F0B3B4|nr:MULTISPECIES: hypothetical protein [unclassified Nocardioides]GAW51571.1 hypothetical protein PD653B2_3914 [Nocardioides sp. PD653-B2]GAW54888.1 hypothetical protein PD653_2303 [Nocardioides sp. PD653]